MAGEGPAPTGGVAAVDARRAIRGRTLLESAIDRWTGARGAPGDHEERGHGQRRQGEREGLVAVDDGGQARHDDDGDELERQFVRDGRGFIERERERGCRPVAIGRKHDPVAALPPIHRHHLVKCCIATLR